MTATQRRRTVLAVNAGSSSLKFGLYAEGQPRALWSGQFEGLEPGGRPRWRSGNGPLQDLPADAGAHAGAFDAALALLVPQVVGRATQLDAVVHRIVHGGAEFVAACLLDAPTIERLRKLAPLAPLHQPHNLAGVAAFARALPGVPQIGCFDTAFHASLPPAERALPLPAELSALGLRRYGFHGLSYAHAVQALAERSARAASGRALLAHLGNGASLCAVEGGRSVATTMGFSALDGLMMGTRSGSLDPGVILHLWSMGWTRERIERLLYKESGLLGVSGLSADMRVLRASGSAAAQAAIALYTQRIVRESGALAALLGGIDLLAFTGGIGEHDAALRAEVAARLGFLGIELDHAANDRADGSQSAVPVHAAASRVEVWVVAADEGAAAARETFAWLDRQAASTAATPARRG
jgi:acetate kinase